MAREELLKELKKLQKRLVEIVHSDFEVLIPSQINWKPSPKKWSITQCLQHLNRVNEYYISRIQQQMDKVKPNPKANTFKSGFLGKYFVQSIQIKEDNRLRKHLKAPKIFITEPDLKVNSYEVLQQYLENQATILKLLDRASQYNLEEVRIPIVLLRFIKIRLGDALRYLVYHNERHIVQAQKIRTEELFPRIHG